MSQLTDFLLNNADTKVIAVVGIVIWLDLRKAVKGMAESVATLTLQMAKIVERVDHHEKRLDKLEG